MFAAEGLVLTILFFHALVYVYPNAVSCNFEEDVCGWSMENFLRTSYQGFNNSIGPWHDHTKESMSETHTAKIGISVRERGSSRKLKTLTYLNDRKNTWCFAIVETTNENNTIASFRIRVDIQNNGNIGLDDVAITPGSCIDCSDHHVFCNWDGESTWTMTRPGLFSANAFSTSLRNESVLTSKSEILPGRKCLSFQYFIEDNCTTYVQVRSYEGVVLSNTRKNVSDRRWTLIYINIDLSSKSRIAVSFVHGSDCYGQYGIGRISLKKGLCPELPMKTLEATSSVFTSSTYIRKDTDTSKDIVITTAVDSIRINSTAVLDISTIATASFVPDNSTAATTTHEPALTSIVPVLSDSIKAGVIVGIVIGCLVTAIGLSLAAFFVYRRRRDSRSRTKSSTRSTVLKEANSGVFWEYNCYDNVKVSSEREYQNSETTYYNAQPEYDTIQ